MKVMAFTLLKSELLSVTSELARKVAQMPGSATERPLDDKRLDYLKGQIMAGQATVFNWAIAVRPDGTERRINGQHSSDVTSKLDGDMPSGLMVNLSHYQVDDERDEILLFRQFDPKMSLRTKSDISGAYQMMEEDLRGVPRPAAKHAAEGIAWYLSRKVGVPVPKGDEVYDLFHTSEYAPFIVWMGNVLTMKTPELKKAPVVGAIFATWEKDPDTAKDFWHNVSRGGEEFSDKAPTTTLDRWLQETKTPKKRRAPITDTQLFQGCIYAWNAQRNGKTAIERINYDMKKGFFDVD
jgi:hypothetical protein